MEEMAQVCEVIGALIDQVEALQKQVATLSATVYDDMIGGMDKLYQANMRVEKVDGLRTKFGDLFKDAEGPYGTLTKGSLYEDLADELEGVSDEEMDGKVKTLAADLLERIKAIKGEPEAAAVVETKPEEPAEEADPMEGVRAAVATMKKRGR